MLPKDTARSIVPENKSVVVGERQEVIRRRVGDFNPIDEIDGEAFVIELVENDHGIELK